MIYIIPFFTIKDVDLLLLQMIVIPIHLQYHWILLVRILFNQIEFTIYMYVFQIVNIADKQIMYFDTLHDMKADVINWIWYT